MISKKQFELLTGVRLVKEGDKFVYYGDLKLNGKKYITELIKNLKVAGTLDLSYSGVKKLSKGLEVESSLNISGTYIKKLRDDTKIGRSLYANDMKNQFSFPKVVNLDYSLEKARADLLYKTSNKSEKVYDKLTLKSELTFEEVSVCYRIISGTDAILIKDFINNKLEENKKDKYSIQEIIDMTEGGWSSESFKNFFL